MEDKMCPNCNGVMLFKQGISKKGKPYNGHFCQNKACGVIEWGNTPKTAQPPLKTPVIAKESPFNGYHKNDARISALAIVKSLIEAGAYEIGTREHADIKERIYSDVVDFEERFRDA